MATNVVSEYYDGSRIFTSFSEYLGMSVDKVNFIISQLVALGLASLFRTVLHPSKADAVTRHLFGLIFGLFIGYFCFGSQAIHLTLMPALCYVVIRTCIQNPETMQRYVLAVSLTYLSCIHLHRQFYDYGSYSLDITGPLMVITQKVTSLAYNIHDGLTKNSSKMTKTQKLYAVYKVPSPLEYFSFILQFPALMVGPTMFYKEYIEFIDGTNLTNNFDHNSNNDNSKPLVIIEPSPTPTVCKKVFLSLIYAVIFVKILPYFPISRVKDNSGFVESTSLVNKFWYLIVSTTLVRFKYYFAWTLSDAICNNSGIGFNGYDSNGQAMWNKFSNVDIFKFEFGTNMRESIEAWNMGTNRWLRIVVYDRVRKYPTALTYALSALWHGFYPGYYMTFASGALFTIAGRTMRRTVRDYFTFNTETKLLYDILTCITTRLVMAYITFTFVLLEFSPGIYLYMHMYWCLHILALMAIFLVPQLVPRNVSASTKYSIAQALHQVRTNDVSRHHD